MHKIRIFKLYHASTSVAYTFYKCPYSMFKKSRIINILIVCLFCFYLDKYMQQFLLRLLLPK